MKKKNLIVLLILPFIISLLGVITVNVTVKTIERDILAIEWAYNDMEAFQIDGDKTYRLQATAVTDKSAPLAPGNELVWRVDNRDVEQADCAEIVQTSGAYYLKPLSEGEVTITCSNEKGNCSRRMSAIIYENGAILVQTSIGNSQNNIDDTIYFGEYDLKNGNKQKANIQLSLKCAPTSLKKQLSLKAKSDNVIFDMASEKISVLSADDSYLTFSAMQGTIEITYTYRFKVVKDGVNVYTYDDLMNCTNRSKDGEIVVLRKSFESLSNTYNFSNGEVYTLNGAPVYKANNVENFGFFSNYLGNKKFNFRNDVYRFSTTYSTNFIDQWNQFAAANSSKYKSLSIELVAGLRVQKDFYGNGYTINMHNLTYPYESHTPNGSSIEVPYPVKENLFNGPLPFYMLGDPGNMPLVSAFGQDNVGMYVDGDNIRINDVVLKNCDFGSSLSFLKYTGTVLEIGGNNVTIENSRISSGKNVVRAFSADNTTIRNCSISYAQNFLLFLGSNEITPIDEKKTCDVYNESGSLYTTTVKAYLQANGVADNILLNYLMSANDAATMKNTLSAMQAALNSPKTEKTPINVKVTDTLFYRSGVASIALDTAFNGPFLYSKNPTFISNIFEEITDKTQEGRKLVPFLAENVSGISTPVYLNISGATKFYDYKTSDEMDLSGLIEEDMTAAVGAVLGDMNALDREVTIDDVFPLKSMLFRDAERTGRTYKVNDKTYVNIPIAYYGGGVNLSKVTYTDLEKVEEMTEPLALDWITEYLGNVGDISQEDMSSLKYLVQRMVTTVTGFESFKFVCMNGNGYLYGEGPSENQLRENIKG